VTNITPWLFSQNQVYANAYDSKFDEGINATPELGLQLFLATYNTISLGRTTRLQVDFFYESPYRNGLSDYSARYNLSFALSQSFMNKQLQVSLVAHDVLDTGSLRSVVSEINGVIVDFGSNYSNRFLRLSVSYNFGNNKINVRNRNFGNDDERRRSN